MGTRMIIGGFFVLSLLLTIFGYFSLSSELMHVCPWKAPYDFSYFCSDFWETLGKTLLFTSATLSTIFLFLLFIPKAFSAWWKFAIWYIPLAAILLAVYNPNPGDWAAPPREWIILAVSGIYLVVSLTIIAIAALRKQR